MAISSSQEAPKRSITATLAMEANATRGQVEAEVAVSAAAAETGQLAPAQADTGPRVASYQQAEVQAVVAVDGRAPSKT